MTALFTDGSCMQVVRDKAVIKPAKGKRQCNCKNKLVTRQVCSQEACKNDSGLPHRLTLPC